MKTITILIISICFQLSVFSQVSDKRFADDMEEINEYMLAGEYSDALPILQKLEKNGMANANINYKLGICYLNMLHYKERSISYLENASKTPQINTTQTT